MQEVVSFDYYLEQRIILELLVKTLKCVTIHDLSVFIYQSMQEKLPVAGVLYYFGLFT